MSSDWSFHLVEIERATARVRLLLAERRFDEAKEKAILIEQCARALVEDCKRATPIYIAHFPPWGGAE